MNYLSAETIDAISKIVVAKRKGSEPIHTEIVGKAFFKRCCGIRMIRVGVFRSHVDGVCTSRRGHGAREVDELICPCCLTSETQAYV